MLNQKGIWTSNINIRICIKKKKNKPARSNAKTVHSIFLVCEEVHECVCVRVRAGNAQRALSMRVCDQERLVCVMIYL